MCYGFAVTRDETLACLKAALPDLRARYGVVRLGVFGSVARDEAGPNSDVDLVAEFAPDAKIGMFKLFDLERDLSDLVGRPAVISAMSQMNPYVRASVERDLVYAQ